MDLISPIALLAMMQAPAAADAMSASSQWQIATIERGCEISQSFGQAGDRLVIRRQPTEGVSTVRLEMAALPVNTGAVTLRNERSGEATSSDALFGQIDGTQRRYVQAGFVDNVFLEKLAPGAAVSFSADRQPIAKLSLGNLDAAWLAMEQCEAALLREWGVDPAALAELKARPRPVNDPRRWVTTDDYPPAAIRVRFQRDATLRFRITSAGRVEDCAVAETSGSAALDTTACALVTRRARYSPALAADGSPHDAWAVQTVRWSRM